MKAISIKQPWASQIARGEKRLEFRSWATSHRGPMLVVASKSPELPGLPAGAAVCVVDVVGVRETHDGYAWELANPRPVEPFPVRGSAAHYHVADELIRLVSGAELPPSPPRSPPAPRRARAPSGSMDPDFVHPVLAAQAALRRKIRA